VALLLRQAGHEVYTPTLSGLGAARLCEREDRLSRSSCPRHGDRDSFIEQVIPFLERRPKGAG
jgi:hypothetical protein